MKRVYFKVWGRGIGSLTIPAYAMASEWESWDQATLRSICSKSRCYVGAGPRVDSWDSSGRTTLTATLCRGDGIQVAEVWFCRD
jgi:hypothetical protein